MARKPKNVGTLLDSLNEILEDVKGNQRLKTRTVNLEEIDVCGIRKKYHMTQLEFATMFGFSLRTLQQWEQGRRQPQGASKVLLKVIDYAPEVVDKALHQ